jgi:hypothetical protein
MIWEMNGTNVTLDYHKLDELFSEPEKGPYVIEDERKAHEMNANIFVVMRDTFLSGWGHAPSSSIFVVACPNISIAEQVAYHAENRRTEMKYVTIRRTPTLTLASRRLSDGDHVKVIGVNQHWCGWHWTERGEEKIRQLWKEE